MLLIGLMAPIIRMEWPPYRQSTMSSDYAIAVDYAKENEPKWEKKEEKIILIWNCLILAWNRQQQTESNRIESHRIGHWTIK